MFVCWNSSPIAVLLTFSLSGRFFFYSLFAFECFDLFIAHTNTHIQPFSCFSLLNALVSSLSLLSLSLSHFHVSCFIVFIFLSLLFYGLFALLSHCVYYVIFTTPTTYRFYYSLHLLPFAGLLILSLMFRVCVFCMHVLHYILIHLNILAVERDGDECISFLFL